MAAAGRCRHYTTHRSQFKCPGDKLKLATGCSVDTVITMEAGPLVEAALAACPQLRRVAWTPTLQEAEQEQGEKQGDWGDKGWIWSVLRNAFRRPKCC